MEGLNFWPYLNEYEFFVLWRIESFRDSDYQFKETMDRPEPSNALRTIFFTQPCLTTLPLKAQPSSAR
jgi:hypothetical protein